MKNKILLALTIYIAFVSLCQALDSDTHKYLNEDIAKKTLNNFSLDEYLKNQLSLQKGIYEQLSSSISKNNLNVSEWMRDGGLYEDKPPWVLPYIRSANHFHDSITDKGFTGVPPGDSAIVWSQKPLGQQWIGGHYSWLDSRDNFYQALICTGKTEREEKLAETFRGVGQLMHLMQDMSVPEHARNDFHALPAYEEWLKEKSSLPYIDAALTTPTYPDSSLLLQQSRFSNANIPIANLFDTNQYSGIVAVATTGPTFGLSEYTNANYFSPDTIFSSGYPFPRWGAMQEWNEIINPTTGKKRTYLRKVGDGENIEHAAAGKWFYKYLPTAMKTAGYGLKLDEKVYADYATKLLPRAVGYSAALLNYFFRGTMTTTTTPGDISFRSVKVTAANNTLGEAMGVGEVSLVIRYKPLTETPLGGNHYLLNFPSADFSYKIAKLTNVDLSTPKELTFDFSADPLPHSFDDMTMQLVFRGPLGNESDAVAVSTPAPITGIYSDFALYLPTSGVYAKTTGSSFDELKLTALTDIPGGLTGGSIELALQYNEATTDPFQSLPFDLVPTDGAAYIIKMPEKNGVTDLSEGVPVELTFQLSSVPLSIFATDVYLHVLYKEAGTGTVTSIGYLDISEPTPVDVFNNTDYVCLNNTWYLSGSAAALAITDINSDGKADLTDIYSHNLSNIYVKHSSLSGTAQASSTSYDFFEPGPLTPATYKRLGYILTDYSFNYDFLESWINRDPNDTWTAIGENEMFTGTAVKNQSDPEGGYQAPAMFNMRGHKMWWGAGVIFENFSYPVNSTCDWSTLP